MYIPFCVPAFNCVLIGVFYVSMVGCTREQTNPHQESPPLVVEKNSLDLGMMWSGTTTQRMINYRNAGQKDLTVAFKSSCGCMVLKESPTTVAAGQRGCIKIELTVPTLVGNASEASFQQYLLPVVKDSNAMPATWLLTGRILPLLECSRSHIELEELMQGESNQTGGLEVHITSSTPLDSLEVVDPKGAIFMTLERISASKFVLLVEAKPDVPKSEDYFKIISLKCRMQTGEELVVDSFSVSGRLRGRLRAVPSLLNLGYSHIGETIERRIVVQPESSERLRYLSHVTESDDTHIRLESSSEKKAVFSLRQKISSVGLTQSSFVINFEVDRSGKVDVSVPLTYFGVK